MKKSRIVILMLVLSVIVTAIFAYSRILHPTGGIIPGLYAVRVGGNGTPMVNFFIMQAGEKYIAFDVGTNSAQTEIELQKLSISADDIISVFITHSDFDHIGSVDLFENAIIYTGDTGNSQFPDIPHHIMPDGGIIDIYGTAIQCLYTPGHTIDSVSFLVDGKYLFVGDLLVPPNTARYSAELQITNKEKVLGINEVEYVFSGHFGLFKDVWLISLIFN